MDPIEIDRRLVDVLVQVARSVPMEVPVTHPDWGRYVGQLCRKPHGYDESLPVIEQRRRSVAYALGYLPRYLPRIREALTSAGLALDGLISAVGPKVTIVDAGCGPGTCSIALLQELQRAAVSRNTDVRVRMYARDRSPVHLEIASANVRLATQAGLWPRVQLDWIPDRSDLFDAAPDAADLVIFGHSICEKYQRRRAITTDTLQELFEEALVMVRGALKPRGVAVILEPPLETKAWAAIEFRELVRDQSDLAILGPCQRARAHCPELGRPQMNRYCQAMTPPIAWDSRENAGARLLEVMMEAGFAGAPEAVLRGKGLVEGPGLLSFFALVLARRARDDAPNYVGTAIARRGKGSYTAVCLPDGESAALRLLKVDSPGGSPEAVRFETLAVQDPIPIPGKVQVQARITPWSLSALYDDGWA